MSVVDSSVFSATTFNPLGTNKFRTRDDVIEACNDLFEPLLPYFSPGKARVQLDSTTSSWDRASCDLEGWARPLFGIVPMVAGGQNFAHWEIYREGLKNGTDPKHEEFWGVVDDMDQRRVEATAIGYALLVVPDHIWHPLDESTKRNVSTWLIKSRNGRHAGNNHMFFRVFVDLGLRNVGVEVDKTMTEDYLTRLDKLYIGDGWYRDGNDNGDSRRIDYYNPWAMHLYGLLYAKYCPEDQARCKRFKDRAQKFAQHFQHWFADTGANVPYGRSLVYRHCVVAFWAALALNDIEALPWGVMKGLYLRNLRWWATQPISRNGDGLLTYGYSYPNQLISERYSSSGSPWWSMKAFVSLAIPAEHPFWKSTEDPIFGRGYGTASQISGMVFTHQPGHTVLLVSGPETGQLMRGTPEKYKKFAYSSRYGFSVESDSLGFKIGAFDSVIAFSDDGVHYRVREHCKTAKIVGNRLYSLWYPWPDVEVETWLIPDREWHLRLHRIRSLRGRPLYTIEGGFAAPRTDFKQDRSIVEGSSAYVLSRFGDFSGIIDQSADKRQARITQPHGNTNVMFPRTLVPQLEGRIDSDEVVFACAILAGPDVQKMGDLWHKPPSCPPVDTCERLFSEQGLTVEICKEI